MTEIGHPEVAAFAGDRVNLPSDAAKRYRDQVDALIGRLQAKIADDPAYDLVKALHAGSVAKGTALKTVNDLDVAVYVKAGSAPVEDGKLMPWLRDRLIEANPNMDPSQFVTNEHCVTVSFKGTGLDVDVVPVLYEGAANDCGYLVRKRTGQRVLTSIPLHLKFIRTRKTKYGPEFAQLIRIVKWWKKQVLTTDSEFRFKSFMIELIWAHLADTGADLDDYPTALEAFFGFVVKTELRNRISFTDSYPASKLPAGRQGAIEVFDPVNPKNNVAMNYTDADRAKIVTAAHAALNAIGEARFAITKGEEVECWQDVLGPGFRG